MPGFLSDLLFLFQRLNLISFLDITLVAVIFFAILITVRDTQAVVILRGIIFLLILISLLTTTLNMPAFSWLISNAFPAFIISIPVIFAPELRKALEKLGRAGSRALFSPNGAHSSSAIEQTIKAVVAASARLSARQHGALTVLQRNDNLKEYADTGVKLNADVTPELLLQIFYPNTPLHDGAAILAGNKVLAAACVMPLSASGVLNRSPDRQMGLRHRAALGISEASDAICVVVSEETGSISIAHGGRMIRRLDSERLENILMAFYQTTKTQTPLQKFSKFLRFSSSEEESA